MTVLFQGRSAASMCPAIALLMTGWVAGSGQTPPQYFQSSADGKTYELRQPDESTLVLYLPDGSIAASLTRKKPTDKFKGETIRLAPGCPGGRGKFEIVEMTESRIRVRAEKPTSATINGGHPCLMPLMNSWNNFDLIRGQAPTQQVAQVAQGGQGNGSQPQTGGGQIGRTPGQQQATNQQQNAGRGGPQGTPTRQGGTQTSQGGNAAAVAAKDDPAARVVAAAARPSAREELVFHTFLPNSELITYSKIQLDESGNIYIGFVCKGVPGVAKLDKSGKFFHFRTTITPNGTPPDFCSPQSQWGQNSPDAQVTSLALGKDGRIYFAGFVTNARGFITKNAARPTPPERGSDGNRVNYGEEGFLARLSSDGRSVEYATLWGGVDEDRINAIAVDESGGVWTAGQTKSKDFPRISNLYDYQGNWDAFVTYFDQAGKPRFSTTFGTTADDRANCRLHRQE